jgi:hypothetical protein
LYKKLSSQRMDLPNQCWDLLTGQKVLKGA